MKKLRKFLTVSVMVLSIIAMSGLTIAPSANAAASTGDLIKMAGNTSVYYLGADGKRYVFPNSTTYFSWYTDFSGVVTIPAAELQSYPLGGNVTMRPGTKLVKITTDPKVYVVEPNGVLRGIQTEAQAASLFGTSWNKRVVDVPDAFFTNYTTGTALATGATPAGSIVKNAGSASVYYYDGTNYRTIANETAFNANRFQWANVITISNTIAAGGTTVSTAEFVNVSQGGSTGTIITGSGLMVSLSASTPASVSVPLNGSRVPMAKVNLTAANDGAVTVNSITVKRIGLSVYNQIDKIWAEKDGEIVAPKKSMNSNDESILVFSPALTINAGQTASLDLIVGLKDYNSQTGNIGLSINAASAISATAASVTGSFPVNGNLMSPTSYTVVNLGLTATSTVGSVKVGDTNVELGHFEVTFNTASSTAKDTTIKSLTLKNNGVEDLATAMSNMYIEYSGSKVSTSYTVDGRYVTFYFGTGLDLLKDDSSKILYIKGDIISKENTSDPAFKLILNKSTDLVAYEKSTGFAVNVLDGTSGGTAADGKLLVSVNITAGVLSVSKKSTSPSDTSIVKGSDNVMLLASIRADEAITVDGMRVHYAPSVSASSTEFENVRVYINDLLLDSFDPSVATGSYVDVDSTFTLKQGDNEVKIMARAKSNALAGSDIKFSLLGTDIFTNANPEYVASGNQVTETPGGSANGAIFTVQGASLITVRNDGYSDTKGVVQGATDVSLAKFNVKASNDDVKVTSIAFSKNSTATNTTINVSSISDMKLYVDGVQVGNTTDFGSSGVTFSSLNFTIAKDSTKSIELKGSFDSSAEGNFATTMTINAQDSRGTSVVNSNTADSVYLSMLTTGTLTVALAGDTPSEGILASKAGVEQEVAQFKFTAQDDSANLTEINVINTPLASSTNDVASTSDGVVDADSRIASIKLYDGATLIDSFVPVYGEGKFTITNNKIVIPANTSKTLSVKVVLNDISNDASATNKDIHLGITTVKSKSSAGSESTQGVAALANNFRIRKTVPTIALQVLPSTLLTTGNQVVSKFSVSADANGDVTLGKVAINYATSTGVTIATMSSNGVRINGSTKNFESTVSVASSTITINFGDTPEIISAGTTKTFEIFTNVTAVGTDSQSLVTSLNEEASYVVSSNADSSTAVDGVTNGTFVWSDGSHVTTYTYTNGHNVSGLPTYTQSMTKN